MNNNESKKSRWWIYVVAIVVIVIIILLLLHSCGKGKKYKITLHYGDETIEVDSNFKLSDLDVAGGKISFLVDSDGHIVPPGTKLDPDKEYSAHIIPDGKESVKVTYKVDDKSTVYEYQKGSGLLFPEDPVKKGYVFIGWYDKEIDDYPIFMMPVEHDMVLEAVFDKSKEENGKCTVNCDTNNDGSCDVNCDKNSDGKPDINIDTDGDGKPDTNIDVNGDGTCDVNCDTNGDGKCDKECYGSEIIYDTQDKLVEYECYEHGPTEPLYMVFYVTKEQYRYLKIDGKEYEANGDDPVWFDVSEFRRSNKTVNIEAGAILADYNGQQYFRVLYAKAFFEGNCEDNVKEITYKCEDYDNDGGFLFTSPVKKDQVKSIKVDGKKIKTATYKDGYPVYDLSDFFEDEKTLNIEIEYTKPDKDGNTSYNAKVVFPKCEFGVTEYTLKLDANGGKVNPTSMRFIVGQIIYDLPTPTRSGYQFVGWYTKKSGGKLIEDTPMPEKDITVYAVWESNATPNQEYTLTYNANGGSVSLESKQIKDGEKYGSLPTPSRRGYTFDGWYTAKDGGSKVTEDTKISKDTTIYAHWTEEVDNGTISLVADKTCLVRTTATLTATVKNAKDSTITWDSDDCLTLSGSGNNRTVTANDCTRPAKVTASLANGQKATITFTYEPSLTLTVYNYGREITPSNGFYEGNNIKVVANTKATFVATNNGYNRLKSSTDTEAEINSTADATVTVTTPCGQHKTIEVRAVIN